MGKSARLKKLRRQARQLGLHPTKSAFARRFQQQHPNGVILAAGTAEKMSEVLAEFAEPLLTAADSPEDAEQALQFAMAAWNYSLLDSVENAPDSLDPFLLAHPAAREMFEFLVTRKQQRYADNRRVLLDYELIPNGANLQFNVISTVG